MKMKFLILAVSVSCFIGAACNQPAANANANTAAANANKTAAATPANAPTPEVAKAKSGKDLYTVNCMTCHKDSGKGGKVTVDGKTMEPDDLTSAKMKAKSDEKLYSYVHDGIEDEGMPAFKDKMSADEIKAVVQHVRDLQK
ncbi:MAG: cytochrome c [Pyrinomonadaceae bacterium]